LEQLGQAAVREFEELSRSPDGNTLDLETHSQRLQAKLEQLYALAATLAQRENNLEGVAAIWARMVDVCDRMSCALANSRVGHAPHIDSRDRIVQIRNFCEENRALHA
jgi:hypothetical protein